ncbi:MAG: hypothetical protein IJT23_00510 [Clostridia bacterium]|nr:hypothetical protein [Clostridia bacterium]
MRELLDELWYGNVTPQEQYTNHHPEVDELLRLADKNLTKLSDTLTEEQKELLKKYDESIGELNSIIERDLFIYAFRLGGRFMVEMLLQEEY